MIENMRGVLTANIRIDKSATKAHADSNDWLETLHSIKHDIDRELIDLDDERTRYILSK